MKPKTSKKPESVVREIKLLLYVQNPDIKKAKPSGGSAHDYVDLPPTPSKF
jgi:hypothetical protein